MDRIFTAVRVAGRVGCLALAGAGVFAASLHHAACAAWLAVGLFSVWYIGQTLLALSTPFLLCAQLAAAVRVQAVLAALTSWRRRLRARAALARTSLRRARGDRVFVRRAVAAFFLLAILVSVPVSLSATLPNLPTGGTSPWETVGVKLCELFYGKLGKALAIVAVVIGGLLYAFGEGGSKSQLAGIAFGTGMVLLAPAFLTWLFGGSGMTCTSAFGGSGTGGIPGIPGI